MLALLSLEGKPHLSCTKSSVYHSVWKAQFLFHHSIVLVTKSNFLCPRLLWQNETEQHCGMVCEEGFVVVRISIQAILYCASTYADTHRIQIYPMVMSSKTTWLYINLATQFLCSSQWQFGFSSMPRKILCCAKLFQLLYNGLYHRSRDSWPVLNSAVIISHLVEVNNSKPLYLPHHVVNVRITMVTLYALHNVLCWNYH